MIIQKQMNKKSSIAGVLIGVLVLVAVALPFISRSGAGGGDTPAEQKEFFSVDDGNTWFVESGDKVPPFDHEGKPAYRVRVFSCPHGKKFVSHMERYSEADRPRVAAVLAKGAKTPEDLKVLSAVELKKPGQADWIKNNTENAPRLSAITAPRCPEGSMAGVMRVSPE